jgi:hypothetical protein
MQSTRSPWRTLAAGIEYREYYLPGPNRAYVARMQLSNPAVTLETSLANGFLTAGLEPLSDQAERYDQAIGYWGGEYGARSDVVVAINGGFFDPTTGMPADGLVQSGWYVKRFNDRENVGGFAWRFDRQAFVSECFVQRPGRQQVLLQETNESIAFEGINAVPSEDGLVLFTFHWGRSTPASKAGLEILVELDRPLELMAESNKVEGTVSEIHVDQGETLIPFDAVVLSAHGEAADAMQGKFQPGTRISISQEIRHLEGGCRKERQETMNGVYTALGGGAIFLREGQVQPLSDLGSVLSNPRTAVAMNDRYVFFIVVDGRDQLRSLGMSMVELGLFAQLHLDAQWGVAMDGGGSSTMVVDGQVVNNPNAETIVRARLDKQPRAVADGLMMVVVEPEQSSQKFQAGDAVTIVSGTDANLRLGPGTNYASRAVLPAGSPGVILDHALNGIQAKGHSWWKADFGGQAGWVSETFVQPAG